MEEKKLYFTVNNEKCYLLVLWKVTWRLFLKLQKKINYIVTYAKKMKENWSYNMFPHDCFGKIPTDKICHTSVCALKFDLHT